MDISITKRPNFDQIVVHRVDGTMVPTVFPKKGPLPHDALHYFVERGFGFREGFWGMVAAGYHPEQLALIARDGGHASAKRAGIPDAGIVCLLQAERIVECYEAEFWSGIADDESLAEMARVACEASHVPLPDWSDGTLARVRQDIADFACDWIEGEEGYTAHLHWPVLAA